MTTLFDNDKIYITSISVDTINGKKNTNIWMNSDIRLGWGGESPFIWFSTSPGRFELPAEDMGFVWFPESGKNYQVMQRVHKRGSDGSLHRHWSMYTKGSDFKTDKKRINVPYGSDFIRYDFENTSSFDVWRTCSYVDTSKYSLGFTDMGNIIFKIYNRRGEVVFSYDEKDLTINGIKILETLNNLQKQIDGIKSVK